MTYLKICFLVIFLMTSGLSCTSKKKSFEDDEFATTTDDSSASDADLNFDDNASGDSAGSGDPATAETDEFADFEGESTNTAATDSAASPVEDDLEKEMDQLETPGAAVAEAPVEPAPDQTATDIPPPEVALDQPVELVPPSEIVTGSPTESAPPAAAASAELSQINSVKYQTNQSGGTVIINSNQPLQFTTRLNSVTNQLVVEVQNSIVPKKLKRSLNTKDMASSIGSVDIYQKPKSKVARFVVQLRAGSPEPLVQPEGNSLLIVGGANPSFAKSSNNSSADGATGADTADSAAATTQSQDINPDLTSEGIMNVQSLEDFLASNNKYYGKKISIEASKLNIIEAFKFLAEESGVNMIVDEDVSGDVTLKLRQVPWDQAFVLILKSKKLGYKRQGNVLRIGSVAALIREEEDAIKLKEARLGNEPLTVKRFFIGYSDIADLEKKIKDFLSSTTLSPTGALVQTPARGKVISDTRTSSLIVTETPTNIARIERLIAALDSQPQQVLIEGKVIEASEKFIRNMGVNWSTPATGADAAPATNRIRPSFAFNPGIGSSIFTPTVGIGIPGRPGDLGNLTASLSLGEKEDKLRVLSAPRIAVLSNQKATISQTVNVAVEKSSTASVSTGTTTVTTESVAVGVSLDVTPQVSNEGTVVMDLTIERSFPGSNKSSEIEKRNAKTKVIVRSGQTAVIGGIFQADTFESAAGIPFLKDIPLFGILFKGQQKSKNKNELVIFVTPRILKPVQGESTASSVIE